MTRKPKQKIDESNDGDPTTLESLTKMLADNPELAEKLSKKISEESKLCLGVSQSITGAPCADCNANDDLFKESDGTILCVKCIKNRNENKEVK